MGYITATETKQIKDALKKEFGKTYKFSVKRVNATGVDVSILSGPAFDTYHTTDIKERPVVVDLNTDRSIISVSTTYEGYSEKDVKVIKRIFDIIKYGSDRKYYHTVEKNSDDNETAFYYNLYIGTGNNPYVITDK